MPAWMTPLLWVLVSIPGRGWRSSTHTDLPAAPSSDAIARPTTPAPTTATSTSAMSRILDLFDFDGRDFRRQPLALGRAPCEDCQVVGAGGEAADPEAVAAVQETLPVDRRDVGTRAAGRRFADEHRIALH